MCLREKKCIMLQFEEEQFKCWLVVELGQNLLILIFYCPVWPEQCGCKEITKILWSLTVFLNSSLKIWFLCLSHTEYWARRLRGGLGYQNLAGKHQLTSGQPLHSWKPGTVLGLGLQPLGSSLLHPLEIKNQNYHQSYWKCSFPSLFKITLMNNVIKIPHLCIAHLYSFVQRSRFPCRQISVVSSN